MSARQLRMLMISSVVLLAGCANLPASPTWSAAPGSTRTLAQFQVDDALCRGQAERAVATEAPPPGSTPVSAQQRYDQAYYNCMYGFGHRVPVPALPASPPSPASSPSQDSRPAPPPPPPGPPPAPPRTWQRG